MLKKIIFLLRLISYCTVILINTGCNDERNKKLTLPFDSAQLDYYYTGISNDATELTLPEKYKKQSRVFNQQEIGIPVKGCNLGSKYIDANTHYYGLGWFEYENYNYKLIIYNKTGESDTPLLNMQLNSYDANGNLTDALLLGSFFGYEGTDCFSNFVIHSDYTISIDNYVIYRYEEGEGGLSDKLIKKLAPHIYLKEK